MTRRDWQLLSVVMLAAWCLAAAHAFIRPLFQVSDELNYLHTVQLTALQLATPSLHPCIAPPAGVPLEYPPGGGKFGFHRVGAGVLVTACRLGAGATAIPLTRGVLALTLPLMVACTWWLARVAFPSDPVVAPAAAIFTGLQPVLATFSGGVAPDGLANAAAAVSLAIAAHFLLDRPGGAWLVPLALSAVAGAASKDSTLFLGPVVLGVLVTYAAQGHWPRRLAMAAVVGAVLALVMGAGLDSRLATPFPNFGLVAAAAVTHPGRFLGDVAEAYAAHGDGLIRSGLGSLSNFGGGSLELAGALLLLQFVLLLAGGLGFAARVIATGEARVRRFAWFAACTIALAALQVPVRQMMTDSVGPMQGRWLFPVWPLVAVACAAGWRYLVPSGRRVLPLLSLACASIACAGVAQVIGYYYAEWPSTYAWPRVFLRAAEGYDPGEAATHAMAAAATVPGPYRNAILVALLASLVTLVASCARVAAEATSLESSHDQPAHHR